MKNTGLSPSWEISETYLRRVLKFRNFPDAIYFLKMMVPYCEKENHHPVFINTFDKIGVTLTTHSAGNRVTEKDTHLAKIIDTIYESFDLKNS